MKFVFGGSAAFAGALIAGSFLLFLPASIAEPLQRPSDSQGKQKPEPQKQIFPNNGLSIEQDKAPIPTIASEAPLHNTEEIKKASEVGKPTDANKLDTNIGVDSTKTEGSPVMFSATAYSLSGRTASGVYVRKGVIAADRRVLPIGTRVRIESGNYTGEYEVCDTGGAVRGKRIDVWVPSSREAMRFGRRNVKLTILSYPKRATKPRQTLTAAK